MKLDANQPPANGYRSSSLIMESRESGEDAQPHVAQTVRRLLRGRWHWAVVLGVLLAAGLGFAGWMAITPMYQSVASARFAAEIENVLSQRNQQTAVGDFEGFLKEEGRRMTSDEVVTKARLAAASSAAWQEAGISAMSSSEFRDHVWIERKPRDTVFELQFEHESPDVAAAATKALIDAYSDDFASRWSAQNDTALAPLEARRTSLADDREKTWAKIQSNDRAGMGLETVERRLETTIRELAFARNQQKQVIAELENLPQKVDAQSLEMMTAKQIAELETQEGRPSELGQAVMELERLDLERAALIAGGQGPSSNAVRKVDARIAPQQARVEMLAKAARQRLASGEDPRSVALARMRDTLESQIAALDAEARDLQSQLAGIEEQHVKLTKLDRELEEVKGVIDVRRKGQIGTPLQVMSTGSLPTAPHNDGRRKQLAAAGGIAGLGLGFVLVLLWGHLSREIRDSTDASADLPATRMLGVLPTLPENMADPAQAEQAAHSVHHIRTLLQINRDDSGQVFSITSPAPASGKSSLCVALGLSFASSRSKTLLIDADMVGSGLSRRLGFVSRRTIEQMLVGDRRVSDLQLETAKARAVAEETPLGEVLVDMGLLTAADLDDLNARRQRSKLGLLDACSGEPLTRCVAQTDVEDLYVLPVGTARPRDAGALSPKAFRGLIAEARERFDIVLVDTGPILGSLEASIAATEADGSIFILARGESKSLAHRSLQHLQSIGATVAGVVFNHASPADVERSSYASVVSQSRYEDPALRQAPDAAQSERLGPLGVAVVTHGTVQSRPPEQQAADIGLATTNGSSRNGHHT